MLIKIVTGPNRWKLARFDKRGLRYRDEWQRPVGISMLQANTASGGSSITGAVTGAVLAGGIGAIVGGMAGSKGDVSFVLELTSGEHVVCATSPRFFAGIVAIVNRMAFEPPKKPKQERGFNWFWAIVFGPLYIARYGFGWFLVGALITLGTAGMSWPFMALGSRYLQTRRELARIGG